MPVGAGGVMLLVPVVVFGMHHDPQFKMEVSSCDVDPHACVAHSPQRSFSSCFDPLYSLPWRGGRRGCKGPVAPVVLDDHVVAVTAAPGTALVWTATAALDDV